MDGSGEGRCVGKVHGTEVLYLGTQRNAGYCNIHHFVHAAGTRNLNTQQLVAVPVGDHLGDKSGSIGIVVSFVISDTGYGDGIEALILGLSLGQTGAAGIQILGQLYNTGTQAAAVGGGNPGQVLGQAPSGYVGGRAHGRPLRLSGDPVKDLGAVAHGINIGQIGFLVFVHNDGAPVHFQAGAVEEGGGGTHTNGQNDYFAGECADAGAHAAGFVAAQHFFQSGTGDDAQSSGLQLAADVLCHIGIKQVGHDLVGHIHNGYFQTLRHQVLGNFQTDEATAYHYGIAAVVLLHIAAQTDGVVRSPHGEYTGQIGSAHVGYEGEGTGGNNQFVIANGFAVGEGDRLCVCVNAHSFHPGTNLGTGEGGELGGGIDDQFLPGFDAAAHVIGQAASGIGNVGSFGVNADFCAAILAQNFGLCLGTGSHASDYDVFHASHSLFRLGIFSCFPC